MKYKEERARARERARPTRVLLYMCILQSTCLVATHSSDADDYHYCYYTGFLNEAANATLKKFCNEEWVGSHQHVEAECAALYALTWERLSLHRIGAAGRVKGTANVADDTQQTLLDSAVNALLNISVHQFNGTSQADFFTPIAMMVAYTTVAAGAPDRADAIAAAVSTFAVAKFRVEPVNTEICNQDLQRATGEPKKYRHFCFYL